MKKYGKDNRKYTSTHNNYEATTVIQERVGDSEKKWWSLELFQK